MRKGSGSQSRKEFGAVVSKWEVVDKVVINFNCWFVKMGHGVKVVSVGVSKWEVAVKMAINFEWWW